MPEARDRLIRPGNDVALMFTPHRRRPIGITEILADEVGAGTAARGTTRGRSRRRYGYYGAENRSGGSGRRSRGSREALPSWYPRKPLQDVTSVVRAFERRRARLRELEDQRVESPLPNGQFVDDPFGSSSSTPLEHALSLATPKAIVTRRNPPFVGKVPKILHDITNQETGESEFLTPERKLLNSIDKVEKVVKEELKRLKKTPAAKKAERGEKVRTLMSMR